MKVLFDGQRRERGIALVLTLAILVIATILVVGFATSMRTERQASASIANSINATIIAQAATDHAISILDNNIPQPVPPGPTATPKNWIINPGLLTTVEVPAKIVQIPLSSNPSATYSSTAQDAELNVPQLSGSGFTILPTSASMRVAWVPVLKDPSTAASATNPIVGRYGFWIDDESAKININTAVGKPTILDFTKLTPGTIAVNTATYPLGHPSSVNLDTLGTINTANLATAVAQQGGLISVDAIKAYVPSGTGDTFLNSNKFSITTFSRDPEFNVFGKSRLYFMRRATGQLGFPLIQYFRDKDGPNYFPSEENALGADRHAMYYAAAAISAYLNRNDWPGMPARSFVDKWGGPPIGLREADQVAWNLMSLGSFAAGDFTGFTPTTLSGQYFQLANAAPSGQADFVSVNKPNNDAVIGALSGKAILPTYPTPLVNEVCLVISPESYTDGSPPNQVNKYRLKVSLEVELWLPPGYPSYDFGSSKTTIGMTHLLYHVTQAAPGTANSTQEDSKYVDNGFAPPNDNGIKKLWMSDASGVMSPGQYRQVTTTLPIYIRNGGGFSENSVGAEDFTTTGLISVDVQMRLFALAQQKTGPGSYGAKHAYELIPVWDTHDPRTTAPPTTLNPPPPPPPAPNPTPPLSPPADDPNDNIHFQFTLDPTSFSNGQVITRSLEVADPRIGGLAKAWRPSGSFANATTQNVDSMGSVNNATIAAAYDTKKLAFVDLTSPGPSSNRPSTGVLSFLATGIQRSLAGASLKFQPTPTSPPTDLPDWLLLDLVAPNVVAANFPKMSYMNSTAGKLNVNGAIYPTAGGFSAPQRWQPLQALFENMPGVSAGASSASPIVLNILNHTLSGQDYGAAGSYDYPGEICEVQGVADSGATDWDKEILIRNLASSITTKSNIFSVWGVAQTVKKNPANNRSANQGVFESKVAGAVADDTVTGEKRFEAVIERYVWPGVDAMAGNAHVPSSGTYDRTSSGQTQPGLAPPYTGGTWEQIDGPDTPTYPVLPNTDPWAAQAPHYVSTLLESSNNPARALMKYRVIYFKILTE